MIKITVPGSWNFDTPVASLVDVHSRGLDSSYLEKRAAAGIFKHADLRPDPGHALIHLIALGDMEVYGGNRNGDLFPGSPCKLDLPEPNWDRVLLKEANADGTPRYHVRSPETFSDIVHTGNDSRMETFVKYAHTFRNHRNKPFVRPDDKSSAWKKLPMDEKQKLAGLCQSDVKGAEKMAAALGLKILQPDPIHGSIKAAAHNKEMGRGELMIQVPYGPIWDADLEKLASGEDLPFSMAARVPYDQCSSCGHKSPSVDDYCPHVSNHMTEMTKSGHVHGVVNDYATFFDISRVHRPADRIAWSLYGITKAASADPQFEKLAAELALDPEYDLYPPVSVLGLHLPARVQARLNLMEKAAAIEKTVPMLAMSGSPLLKGLKAKEHAPAMTKVALQQLPSLFRALTDRQICLPLEKWAQFVLGDRYPQFSSHVKQAEAALPGAFSRLLHVGDQVAANIVYDPENRLPEGGLRKTAEALERGYALTPDAVSARAVDHVLSGDTITLRPAHGFNTGDPITDGLVKDYLSYKLAYLSEVKRTQPQMLDFALEAAVLQHYR